VFTLEGYLDRMVAQRRFSMALLSLLGLLGLVIASAGVYGVMAYVVSQRTQEIGVRMALGAQPGDVVRMVMRRSALLIGLGLVIGTAGA
jgi:putative ABC transport system permease protein